MRVKNWLRSHWNTGDLAYAGVLLGMLLAGSHGFWHVFEGSLPSEDALFHLALECIAGTLLIAALFGSVSSLWNWMKRG